MHLLVLRCFKLQQKKKLDAADDAFLQSDTLSPLYSESRWLQLLVSFLFWQLQRARRRSWMQQTMRSCRVTHSVPDTHNSPWLQLLVLPSGFWFGNFSWPEEEAGCSR
jgi:hypothetical protein